jgi:Fructosamine kinase
MWPEIAAAISKARGKTFVLMDSPSVSGGCINQSYLLRGVGDNYFAKLNRPDRLAMFEAEAAGLMDLTETQTIAVPQVICWGVTENHSYLVLTDLDLGSSGNDWQMGVDLARMHQFSREDRFGWQRGNTIGSTRSPLGLSISVGRSVAIFSGGGATRSTSPTAPAPSPSLPRSRRSVGWQCGFYENRPAGDFRSGGVLGRSRSRYGHDRAIRKIPGKILSGLCIHLSLRTGL